jgi:hypothetical protein
VSVRGTSIADLPHALADHERLDERLAGRQPAVPRLRRHPHADRRPARGCRDLREHAGCGARAGCPTPRAASRVTRTASRRWWSSSSRPESSRPIPTPCASSSRSRTPEFRRRRHRRQKNAGLFLRQIRLDTFAEEEGLSYDFVTEGLSLLDFFDVDISGRDFPRGKPDPEIFLTGARELDAPPETCFVVEDAVSGVQAAKAGELAALGLARAEDAEILAAAGADLVVTTLDDVDIDGLSEGRLAKKDLARKDG